MSVRPADATLLRSVANGMEAAIRLHGSGSSDATAAYLEAGQIRALADVLNTLVPSVVYVVQKAADDEMDAADSMDTSPGPRYHDLQKAADALASLLTDEQRHQLSVAL